MLNALASARQGSIPATPSIHRLGPGLPGYLIPFAPLAFAHQCQCWSRTPPSPPTSPLRPVIPNNACPPRITAAAGTELAGASSLGTVTPPDCSPGGHSSRSKGVYDPKVFILHAALRRQACAHCEQFPTAASRRSLGRVSVPVCPSALSGRILIVALVSHYPTN